MIMGDFALTMDSDSRKEIFRDSMIGGFTLMIPLVLISVVTILLLNIPSAGYTSWLYSGSASAYRYILLSIYDSIWGNFAFFAVITISWCYGKSIDLSSFQGVILVMSSVISLYVLAGAGTDAFDREYLSQRGMFTAIVALFISCSVFCNMAKWAGATMPSLRINRMFSASMRHFIPVLGVLCVSELVHVVVSLFAPGMTLQSLISSLLTGGVFWVAEFSPLLACILYGILAMGLWYFGIHGQNFLYVINDGAYTNFLNENIVEGADNIVNMTFFNTFCVIGGSGAALSLAIAALIASKNKTTRTVSKIGLLPGIFNSSEIMTYCLPTVFNKNLVIPFISLPLINAIITYAATYFGFIPVIRENISWAMPVLLSGYFSTGSIRGSILQVFLIVIDVLVYIPFVRLNDRAIETSFEADVAELTRILKKAEDEVREIDLMSLSGRMGETARSLAYDLKKDLKHRKLFMVYQAQFDKNNKYMGAEALLRWKHESCGFIYPPLSIELATESGLLYRLEEFVFDEACRSIGIIKSHGGIPCKISANITGVSALNPDFVGMIDRAVKAHNVDPDDLWIEMTEQAVMNSNPSTMARLKDVRDKGHKFLIDDFGMGHTSIDYLKTGMFDGVKLDGKITRDVLDNESDRHIISSVTSMCADMGMIVIAEYVEGERQRDLLKILGGDAFQGYLYSMPISLEDMIELVESRR